MASHPADTEAPPPVALLPDVPSDLERDDFAHRSYVDVLTETLRHAVQPLTIGLLGPWGVGKSSVLRRLRRELRSPECAFVLFDAWRYDDVTLRRQLLRDTAHQLHDQRALDGSFKLDKRLTTLDVDQQTTRLRVGFSWSIAGAALLPAFVVALGILGALQINAVADSLLDQDPRRGGLIALVAGVLTFLGSVAGQLLRPVPYVETRKRLEDPERFHELFGDLAAAVRAPRLVIAVDNLDRCAPDDAIELLATIKTYLEPAAGEQQGDRRTEVLFLLAVDEEALRRHLREGARLDGDQSAEYLRKIFTATIRFAPLLADDLRSYVSARLAEIRTSLRLSPDEEHQLISLTDAALRANPRQVLQFLNNLQLRMRLIRERERGSDPVIRSRVSAEPLMVAKLALIEECWPNAYQQLQQKPQLLEEWHRQARDRALAGALAEWPRFDSFLRIADGIATDNLRALLLLKQSQEELQLPAYDAFHAAAIAGDRDDVEAVLANAGELAGRYVERLGQIFEDELQAGYLIAARSVLDIALTDPRIGPRHPLTVRLLRRALDDPRLADQLDQLPAAPLLHAAVQLDPRLRDAAVDNVVRRLRNASEAASEAAQALAADTDLLAPRHVDLIQQAATTPPLSERVEDLAALASARIELVMPMAATAFAARLAQEPTILHGDGEQAGHAAMLIERIAAVPGHPEIVSSLVGALVGVVRSIDDDSSAQRIGVLTLQLARQGHDVGAIAAEWATKLPDLSPAERHEIARELWPLVAERGTDATLAALTQPLLEETGTLHTLQTWVGQMPPARRGRLTAVVGRAIAARPLHPDLPALLDLLRDVDDGDLRQTAAVIASAWLEGDVPLALFETMVTRLFLVLPPVPRWERVSLHSSTGAMDDRARASLDRLAFVVQLGAGDASAEVPVRRALHQLFASIRDPAEIDLVALGRAVQLTRRLAPDRDVTMRAMVEPLLLLLEMAAPAVQADVIELLTPIQAALTPEQRTVLRIAAMAGWRQSSPPGRRVWLKRLAALDTLVDAAELELRAQAILTHERSDLAPPERARLLALAAQGGSQPVRSRLTELSTSRDPLDQETLRRATLEHPELTRLARG